MMMRVALVFTFSVELVWLAITKGKSTLVETVLSLFTLASLLFTLSW